MPPPVATLRRYPRIKRISPDYSDHPSYVPCPLPRRIERLLMSITSPITRPSPNGRRVGIRIVTFEACSGFTRVTARRIAQLPKATFVTRLQSLRLPARAARQLPDQSTTLRVESSSTGNPRLRGALPTADIERGRREGFALEGRSINTDRAGGPTPSRGLAVKATCGEAGATPLESRL